MHTIVTGEKHAVVFLGDLAPGAAWLHVPITMGYDRFPEKLIEEKAELFEKAVAGKWLVFYIHDPQYAASFVGRNEKGKFVAESPLEKIVRMQI